MQSGYYSAAAGMVTQFNRLDTISNNLANVNTAGFKEDNFTVGTFASYLDVQSSKENLLSGATTKISKKYIDFRLGDMQKSDNYLDFALSDRTLFFVVKTPMGLRLTRDGSFKLDKSSNLVTKSGYKVLQNDYFKTGANIKVKDNIKIANKMMIVKVDDYSALKKEGNNLYVYEKNLNFSDLSGKYDSILQGFIEKSNVNAVKMMTQMIEANRLVEMYQKVMDVQMNDMNRDAIQRIASTSRGGF